MIHSQPIRKTERKRRRARMSRSDRSFNVFAIALVSLLTLVVLLPMINVLSASFSSAAAVNAGKVLLLPVSPTLKNYETIFGYSSVWLGYRNTIFYTAAGTLINVLMTMICAYPLAQKSFPAANSFPCCSLCP